MKAIPIRAHRIKVMPIPRKEAGTLEYVATRSRIAAIAVIARSHPIPHPAPAQVAVQTLPKSRCCMNSEPPSIAQFTAIRGRKMPSEA